ncbi:diaminohydroxyphosphoribosylaminopyrimidine deaminase [Leeuwenhoekiella marinoflava DSM 3653]|uniref:Riboflavin biosynthesis protein RibD n=3 Tax=Leeuwenhoekiella marinoflava TaxID=988 RepID=A0A4V1KST5_9FLAO|nr:diaminohydroxyphosphoribosylaminopyrimidine deaminase [Leeuwenhoekiella marinoflava]SHE59276.1 diaminohydroxyphosphoribosylaminopyrimidine deaminase [Leeuwenhoekiella marinoflava DSM 3653]
MSRCLQLAKNGLGNTYPNPMVGSVIVCDSKIIGEGWHQKAGQPHAEVNAINSVKETELLEKSTIYVSLEPCSHFGKTPPCSDLIIAKGIKKVVIGTVDPFAEVAGRGIKKLLNAGCEVLVGILETECQTLNKRFFTFHQKKRPYVILKWAESLNGFIAPDAESRNKKEPFWITTKTSRQLVHKWRAEEQSILIGANTVKADNPSLTTRDWAGNSPTRIIIDRELSLSKEATVFDQQVPTLVITTLEEENKPNLKYIKVDFTKNLPAQICEALYTEGLQSVIIEGGAKTLQAFIDEKIWDEARVFKGSSIFQSGVKAPVLKAIQNSKNTMLNDDILTFYSSTND